MHRLIRATVVAVVPLVATAAARAQQPAPLVKIAYVNTQEVFQNAPGRAEAEQQFEREMTTTREQVRRMDDSLSVMVNDYQRAASTLDSTARTRRETAIRTKQEEYRQRASQLEQQLGQRRDALLQPIMERIRTALEQIRSEDGYAMIFNNDPQASLIVAADKNLDITDRVVARLKTLAAASPARPATGAAVPAPSGVTRRP